jgi:uncharacterized protein
MGPEHGDEMKRRLRKKKRLGEFREFGFEVDAELRKPLAQDEFDAFLDRLIDFVEARGLAFAGGPVDGHFRGFVSRFARASPSKDDRAAFAAFLAADPAIASHDVHALRDAWHGHD